VYGKLGIASNVWSKWCVGFESRSTIDQHIVVAGTQSYAAFRI